MRRRKMPLPVQVAVCSQLRQLLMAGFSLRVALTIIGLNFPVYQPHWQRLTTKLAAGAPLAEGVAMIGFHPVIVQQLTLATGHGDLAGALGAASQFMQVQTQSRRKLQLLLLYPAVLIGLLVVLQVGLMIGVLPLLSAQPSPLLAEEGLGLAGVVAFGGLMGWRFHRASAPKRAQWLLGLPGVQGAAKQYYQYLFTSGLAQFLAAGLTLADYLNQLSRLAASPLQATAEAVQTALTQGANASSALQQRLVDPAVAELMGLGQSEKVVAEGMRVFAAQRLQAFEATLTRWLAVVQPVMFLLIGGQIVLMYRELLLPLYGGLGGY